MSLGLTQSSPVCRLATPQGHCKETAPRVKEQLSLEHIQEEADACTARVR